jgi:hypothetical protein
MIQSIHRGVRELPVHLNPSERWQWPRLERVPRVITSKRKILQSQPACRFCFRTTSPSQLPCLSLSPCFIPQISFSPAAASPASQQPCTICPKTPSHERRKETTGKTLLGRRKTRLPLPYYARRHKTVWPRANKPLSHMIQRASPLET